MYGNDRGATRRRTVPSSRLSKEEASPDSPLKRQSRKRIRRSLWIVLVITASGCLFVRLVYNQGERPIIPSTNNNSIESHKLLALVYPPGLMGGYRNQVIRFLALVVHALREDFSAMFLPSLLWSTQVGNSTTWVPIPMDLLIDIDYWNSFHPKLPLLVEYNTNENYDCWTVETMTASLPNTASSLSKQVVQRGFLTPIYNISKAIALQQLSLNQRRTDFLSNVSHCQHPVAYGGGTMAGRLWNDYIRLKGDIPFHAQSLVLQALRPKQEWREVAKRCVEKHASSPQSPYIALHARVELEMMNHPCGANMEKNLTKILEMTRNLAGFLGVKGIFVAVGRSGMEHQENRSGYNRFAAYIDENLRTLNRIVNEEPHGLLPVFECGGQALKDHYLTHPETIDHGSLLQGIINFHVATEATAFVGVRGSSYSTDIWMTRYHQGKGDSNYEYTPKGIVKMANGGLPPAHSNCKLKKN